MSTLELGNPTALGGDNSTSAFDVEAARRDFPILERKIHGRPLAFLDSAASAQKPRQVIEAMDEVYREHYANVHRGVYLLSQESTDLFEGARARVAKFLNAAKTEEIVFTRNATEAINLVANCFGQAKLRAGDEVIISHVEHHANIVPWQLLRDRLGIQVKVVPVDDDGNLIMDAYADLLSERTRLVAITHIANSIGTVMPLRQIIDMAHAREVPVLVDGCQAAPHLAVDVQELGCDFYVFAGHKVYGPTGIGVLYGRYDLLNSLPPFLGGGDMISSVSFEKTTFKKAPFRFEAGTPAIVESVGLAKAIDYVSDIGLPAIHAHEDGLLAYATERLTAIDGLTIYGQAKDKAAVISFTLESAHPHDIGTILDRAGVAVRAGHHCAQPTMERFGVPATVRASFGLYNTRAEVDALVDAINQVKELFD